MVPFPRSIDEILNSADFTVCSNQRPHVAMPTMAGRQVKQKKRARTNPLIACILDQIIKRVNNLINIQIDPQGIARKWDSLHQLISFIFNHKQVQASMLSTFGKKIIGMQKRIRPYSFRDRNGISKLIIYKGYEPHYQWLQSNHSSLNENDQIYCYDRCAIDVALEMASRNTTKLTYISTRNYETVDAVKRYLNTPSTSESKETPKQNTKGFFAKSSPPGTAQDGKLLRQILSKQISSRAKDILSNYNFVIQNTFLDIHPLEAYQKICGYLLCRPDEKVLQYFEGFKCSEETIFKSFLLLPLLNQIRSRYLVTDEIKLQTLKRKSDEPISNEAVESYLRRWNEAVGSRTLENAGSRFDEKQKFQWVISHKLGEDISKKDVLDQKYRRFSYAFMG